MASYIKEIRKYVEHRTVIQCAASVICIDEKGRILLGKRSDNHLWGYAGGACEIDEHAEDCAKRELQEEMGIQAEELEFFYVNSGPEAHYIYPNGDEVSNFEIIYLCRKWSGDIKSKDGEMEELSFFSPEEIDLFMISPPIRSVIEKYIEEKGHTNDR